MNKCAEGPAYECPIHSSKKKDIEGIQILVKLNIEMATIQLKAGNFKEAFHALNNAELLVLELMPSYELDNKPNFDYRSPRFVWTTPNEPTIDEAKECQKVNGYDPIGYDFFGFSTSRNDDGSYTSTWQCYNSCD